jgi:hyperosmotically inducible protein
MKPGNIQKLMLAGVLSIAPIFAAAGSQGAPVPAAQTPGSQTQGPVSNEAVHNALNHLSWYGVFDNLEYTVESDGIVTLTGQVTQYSVRNDAVSTVKHVPGVSKVIDKIEILPLSRFDDNIRLRAYKAIYEYPALSMYAIRARGPIRIIVRNGEVTLVGAVASELDRQLVFSRVNALPGTFGVINDLIIN